MSDKINDGGPAFPSNFTSDMHGNPVTAWVQGMSLRDWFAGQALVALVQRKETIIDEDVSSAYDIADAMLEERNGGAK